MLIEDTDQSLSVANQTEMDDALTKRSTQLSLLSMATAMEMGLPGADILLAGSCGLLHDIGLYSLPEKFRDSSQELNHAEAERYRKHPEISASILAEHSIFNDELRLMTMQVHELPDGSG